jgi:uncharacterized protein YbdZ (MbtH family)
MYWIITARGELVNIAHACLIRVHSSDSVNGKHEVRAWFAYGVTELDSGFHTVYSSPDRDACLQFVTDLYLRLKPPVPERAHEEK